VSTGCATTASLAVTTRARLKSPRFFIPVLRANSRIKQQLAHDPGSVRFASIVASPTELWTVSVWRSRHATQQFMRSGAHEELMWNFSRWFASFWLVRWAPTPEEDGAWDGLELADRSQTGPHDFRPDPRWRAAIDTLRELRAAMGPTGAPDFLHAPDTRRQLHRVAGGTAATLRLALPNSAALPAAWTDLRNLSAEVSGSPETLGFVFGLAHPSELFALAVFSTERAWRRWRGTHAVRAILHRWGDGAWLMRWGAQHEFGHWDGARLRRLCLHARQ
jgi:hypothetical protein